MTPLYKWIDIKDVDLTKLGEFKMYHCKSKSGKESLLSGDEIALFGRGYFSEIKLPIEPPTQLTDEAIEKYANSMSSGYPRIDGMKVGAKWMRDLLLPIIASKEEEIKELKDILQGIADSFDPQMRNALTNRQTDAIEDVRQYFLTNQH